MLKIRKITSTVVLEMVMFTFVGCAAKTNTVPKSDSKGVKEESTVKWKVTITSD